jgi:hypothetical protein
MVVGSVPLPDSWNRRTFIVALGSAAAWPIVAPHQTSAFAVLRLMTSSNLVGCSTGRSLARRGRTAPDVQRTLIVRWMPPDPNDRSNVIEQEPD